MSEKNINLGNSDITVNVEATGNVVGANIKSKGSVNRPVYFDANGIAQPANRLINYTAGNYIDVDEFNTISATNFEKIDFTEDYCDENFITYNIDLKNNLDKIMMEKISIMCGEWNKEEQISVVLISERYLYQSEFCR